MKRITAFLLGIALVCLCSTSAIAQKHDDGVLRILAIGNSFSDDGMDHLPALLENLGVKNVELARLYVGGCTLARHTEFYNNNQAAYLFYHSKAGENRWTSQNGVSIQQALAMGEWDIITMQQASGVSGLYESYSPYLEQLISAVNATQPQAEIVWHMTWAYSVESQHPEFPNYDRNQQKMLDAIHQCVRNLKKDYRIKRIIPSGTTIQSLRLSEVNNPPMEFTRDGYHMDYGAGRYAVACTWYETLIKPYTHISMSGNTLRPHMGNMHVDDHNAPYIQKAAKHAVKRPFKVKVVKVN